MPQIIHNPTTGAYAVVDDNNNVIPDAQVGLHKDSGQIFAFDKDMNNIAIYNPKTNHSISISGDNATQGNIPNDKSLQQTQDPNTQQGFFKSAYDQGLKPLVDTAKDFMDTIASPNASNEEPSVKSMPSEFYQNGNYNPDPISKGIDFAAGKAKLLATGLLSQLSNFTDNLIHKGLVNQDTSESIPMFGQISKTAVSQMQQGNYKGALGTLVGAFSPMFTDQIGEGINNAKNSLASLPENAASRLGKAFPPSADTLPSDTSAVASDIATNRSVGQITGNATARNIEQTHGGKVAYDLAQQQRDATASKLAALKSQFVPNGVPDNVNGILQKKLAENYFDAEADKNQQYFDFNTNRADKNTWDIAQEVPNPNYTTAKSTILGPDGKSIVSSEPPTIMQQSKVSGPVVMQETLPLVQDLQAKLQEYKNGPAYSTLPPLSLHKFNELNGVVNDLTKKTASVIDGKVQELPIASYQKVVQIRKDIGDSLSGLKDFKLDDAMLSQIKKALGNDLNNSITKYWADGQAAQNELNNANASHSAFKQLFNPDLKGKIFAGNSNLSKTGGNMADPTTLVDDVGKSPVIAKNFMDALGPQNSNLAKGAVLDKLMKESFDTANQNFSPDKLTNTLQSPGYRKLFSSPERSNIQNVMSQLRTMNPSDLNSKVGITKAAMFHMALPAGAVLGVMSGHALIGGGVGAAIEIGLGQFARRMLLDPKYSRILAQLPYAAAGSAKAGLLQTQLLQALKGSSVGVVLQNGQKIPAQVDNNGKLVVSQ